MIKNLTKWISDLKFDRRTFLRMTGILSVLSGLTAAYARFVEPK